MHKKTRQSPAGTGHGLRPGTTAFATEAGTTTTTGTITVANPVANQEYKAYKIFDVVYDAAKEHYSYTIDRALQEEYNRLAAKTNRSRNELIGMALQYALDHMELKNCGETGNLQPL